MARTKAALGNGSWLADYLSVSLLARLLRESLRHVADSFAYKFRFMKSISNR